MKLWNYPYSSKKSKKLPFTALARSECLRDLLVAAVLVSSPEPTRCPSWLRRVASKFTVTTWTEQTHVWAPPTSCWAPNQSMASVRSRLFSATVVHTRYTPVHNSFNYPVYYYAFDLDELESLSNSVRAVALRISFSLCQSDELLPFLVFPVP